MVVGLVLRCYQIVFVDGWWGVVLLLCGIVLASCGGLAFILFVDFLRIYWLC